MGLIPHKKHPLHSTIVRSNLNGRHDANQSHQPYVLFLELLQVGRSYCLLTFWESVIPSHVNACLPGKVLRRGDSMLKFNASSSCWWCSVKWEALFWKPGKLKEYTVLIQLNSSLITSLLLTLSLSKQHVYLVRGAPIIGIGHISVRFVLLLELLQVGMSCCLLIFWEPVIPNHVKLCSPQKVLRPFNQHHLIAQHSFHRIHKLILVPLSLNRQLLVPESGHCPDKLNSIPNYLGCALGRTIDDTFESFLIELQQHLFMHKIFTLANEIVEAEFMFPLLCRFDLQLWVTLNNTFHFLD